MIYLFELYLIVCVLFLAGKDADSYQLKEKTDNGLSAGRVKRWHRDGLILFVLYLLPLIVWDARDAWKTVIGGALIRGALFDLAFNHWASLSTSYLGGTAWADKLFVKVFGVNGAILKSSIFLALLIGLNLLNYFL